VPVRMRVPSPFSTDGVFSIDSILSSDYDPRRRVLSLAWTPDDSDADASLPFLSPSLRGL